MHAAHPGFSAPYIVSGLLVGLLVGLTGVGGGSLMTPLLMLIFGFSPSTAVGTDLLFAAITKAVGTTIHSAGKTVDWRIVGRLACGSVPATVLVLLGLAYFGTDSKAVAHAMSLTLGITLLISATLLVLRERITKIATQRDVARSAQRSLTLTIAVGFIVGALVTLTSVGAGALGTIALLFLYPRLPIVRIVGSDIAHAVPLTLLAGLGHWYLGSIKIPLLEPLLVGSIPGVIVGSYAARYTPGRALKYALAVMLVLVGVKLLGTV